MIEILIVFPMTFSLPSHNLVWRSSMRIYLRQENHDDHNGDQNVHQIIL
jgi:hypothetical protein